MTRSGMSVASSLLLLAIPAGVHGQALSLRHDYRRLDVAGNESTILDLRLDLELRRAGGPRPEVVDSILQSGRDTRARTWMSRVLMACLEHAVRCGDYLGGARAYADHVRPEYRGDAEKLRAALEREIFLEAMSRDERRALYLKTLRSPGAITGAGPFERFDAGDMAIRALDEGMTDLIPEIEESSRRHAIFMPEGLSARIQCATAKEARDPAKALATLIQLGAQEEATQLLATSGRDRVGARSASTTIAAVLALREFRKLDPRGGADAMREVLAAYEPVRLAKQKARDAFIAQGGFPSDAPSSTAYLGELGWRIVELTGDLGDRDFERKTLGGRCLWDQVHEVELALLKKGQISERTMVTATDER
jgi:hypothetical protein